MKKIVISSFVGFLKAFWEILYSAIADLKSFRNKLIVIATMFVFMAFKSGDATLIEVSLVAWGALIGHYQYVRFKSEKN